MAEGLPGRLTIRLRPRVPAIWRERMAVGTLRSETTRISSPKPGRRRSQTASVASGVTSRGAGGGAARGHDERAAVDIGEAAQHRLDLQPLVRHQAAHGTPAR